MLLLLYHLDNKNVYSLLWRIHIHRSSLYIYVDFHRLKAPYGTINRVAAFRYYVIKGIHFLEHAFLIIPLSLSHSPSLCSTIHSALTEREFGWWIHQAILNQWKETSLFNVVICFFSTFLHETFFFCAAFEYSPFTVNLRRGSNLNAAQWKWKKVAQWMLWLNKRKFLYSTAFGRDCILTLSLFHIFSLPEIKAELLVFIHSLLAILIQPVFTRTSN